jgi:hypothetical protein
MCSKERAGSNPASRTKRFWRKGRRAALSAQCQRWRLGSTPRDRTTACGWNGRHVRFKTGWEKSRGGSSPLKPTSFLTRKLDIGSVSWTAFGFQTRPTRIVTLLSCQAFLVQRTGHRATNPEIKVRFLGRVLRLYSVEVCTGACQASSRGSLPRRAAGNDPEVVEGPGCDPGVSEFESRHSPQSPSSQMPVAPPKRYRPGATPGRDT